MENIAYAPPSSATSSDCAKVEGCTVDRLCIYRVTSPQHICKQDESEPYLAPRCIYPECAAEVER